MALTHASANGTGHGVDASVVQRLLAGVLHPVDLLAFSHRRGRQREVRVRQQQSVPQRDPIQDVVHTIMALWRRQKKRRLPGALTCLQRKVLHRCEPGDDGLPGDA
eukprot:1887749-Prorocentrum_lima.AAC.1